MDVERIDDDMIIITSGKPIIAVPLDKGILITESESITETLTTLEGLGYDTKATVIINH